MRLLIVLAVVGVIAALLLSRLVTPDAIPAQFDSWPLDEGAQAHTLDAVPAQSATPAPLRRQVVVGDVAGEPRQEEQELTGQLMPWVDLPDRTQGDLVMIYDYLLSSGDIASVKESEWKRSIRVSPSQYEMIKATVDRMQLGVDMHSNQVIPLVEPLVDEVEKLIEAGEALPLRLSVACKVFEGKTFSQLTDIKNRMPDGVMATRPFGDGAWLGVWVDSGKVEGLDVVWSARQDFMREQLQRCLSIWRAVTR